MTNQLNRPYMVDTGYEPTIHGRRDIDLTVVYARDLESAIRHLQRVVSGDDPHPTRQWTWATRQQIVEMDNAAQAIADLQANLGRFIEANAEIAGHVMDQIQENQELRDHPPVMIDCNATMAHAAEIVESERAPDDWTDERKDAAYKFSYILAAKLRKPPDPTDHLLDTGTDRPLDVDAAQEREADPEFKHGADYAFNNPIESETEPMTAERFAELTPQQRGYIVYMRGARDDEPNIPDEANPYTCGSADALNWASGQTAAILEAQDEP